MSKILYDDPDFVVVEKKAGIDSEKISMQDIFGPSVKGSLYCIHRLDRGVGGALLTAKNKNAAALLSSLMQKGGIQKSYLALSEGIPEPGSGCFEDLLYHDKKSNKTFVVNRVRKGVKSAVLEYQMLKHLTVDATDCSLLSVLPKTGRTHQIRVQFASRNHPLAGDHKYGSKLNFPGIGLWCSSISFIHPLTGKAILCTSFPEWPDISF